MIINNAGSRCDIDFWTKHLENDEKNDRAELREIRGLQADNLQDALLEMREQARVLPRLQNFMYHADFNPPIGREFSEEEWERTYEIFEKQRGIPEGQPRVVVEHEKNGRIHRHVIWLRADLENMRAFPDGNNDIVAQVAANRIVEEFGLPKVVRAIDFEPGMSRPSRAPEPWEMYRGMQSGIDPRDITAEVTALFQQSENGLEFKAALEQHGYELATGRRGLLILDSAGKEHSLARRVEGVNTAELNAFMRDLDRAALPSVELAKEQFQERKIVALEADRDTVRDEIAWEEALYKAAIAKEENERQFVEPEPGKAKPRADSREKEIEAQHRIEELDRRIFAALLDQAMPSNLKGHAAHIWTALYASDTAKAFANALEEQGITLGAVTKDEADRSHTLASFASEVGNFAPRYREGEIVAVAEPNLAYGPDGTLSDPRVYRLDQRTTGKDRAEIQKFLAPLDRSQLQGIEATKDAIKARAEERITELHGFRDMLRDTKYAERIKKAKEPARAAPTRGGKLKDKAATFERRAVKAVVKIPDAALNIVGPPLEVLGNAFESLFAPKLTPEQIRDGEIAAHERQADVREQIDFSNITAKRAQERQQDEQERAARDRERERER